MQTFSYTYSIPYLIFLGYLFVLMFVEFRQINNGQSTKTTRWLTMAGMLFFFGLRGFVAWDWYNYYPYFMNLKTIGESNWLLQIFNSKSEMGFCLYSILLKTLCPNYFFWIFVSIWIDTVILNAVFKRYCRYYVLSFIIFLSFSGLGIELNLMRNAKSIMLFLLSIKYLQDRKMAKYILLNTIGILFHVSSIVYLPLYFILHRRFSTILLCGIFIAGNIIFFLQLKWISGIIYPLADIIGGRLPNMARAYLTDPSMSMSYKLTYGYIERCIEFIFICIYYKNIEKKYITFANLFVILFICLSFLTEAYVIAFRLSDLFVCSYWILVSYLISRLHITTNKIILISIFILYSFFRVGRNTGNIMMKYENLITGIQQYEDRKQMFEKYAPEVDKRTTQNIKR